MKKKEEIIIRKVDPRKGEGDKVEKEKKREENEKSGYEYQLRCSSK